MKMLSARRPYLFVKGSLVLKCHPPKMFKRIFVVVVVRHNFIFPRRIIGFSSSLMEDQISDILLHM